MTIDDDYVQLVKDHLEATSAASTDVVQELLDLDLDVKAGRLDQDEANRRLDVFRAEQWKAALDAAGLTIGRKEVK